MKPIDPKDIKPFENKHGIDARKVYSKEDAEIIQMNLTPGQTLIKHATPVDVIFYIVEGSGQVLIGDEAIDAQKGQFVESPKNIIHSLSNTGTENFVVLVIKTPKP